MGPLVSPWWPTNLTIPCGESGKTEPFGNTFECPIELSISDKRDTDTSRETTTFDFLKRLILVLTWVSLICILIKRAACYKRLWKKPNGTDMLNTIFLRWHKRYLLALVVIPIGDVFYFFIIQLAESIRDLRRTRVRRTKEL